MTQPPDPPSSGHLAKLSRPGQWGVLIAGSIPLAVLLELTGLPAALLLGPMLAGIVVAIAGGTIRLSRLPVYAAQAVIGCLVARSVTGDIVQRFLHDWPLFVGTMTAIIAASSWFGWLLARWKVLPGTTAVWGTAPGGASVMMVMSASFGADPRLVAFMQYLRVVLVAAVASVVARLWVGASAATAPHIEWLPSISWLDFLATLAIALVGGGIGIGLGIPAGGLLLPMSIGAVAEGMGAVAITLPPWLLAICYAMLGWSIGLGFTRAILLHAARALPQVLLAVFYMMGVCGVLAAVLVYAAGIDPITAYLATCPGGVDSIAIIGAASNADLSFVMALQTVRLLMVLIAGPPLARLIAQRVASSSARRAGADERGRP
jgi:uncharacterized protein